MRIWILVFLVVGACAGDATSEVVGQVTTCAAERGTWPCIGPDFSDQLDELAPPDDAQLWAECQTISGARTCCIGEGDAPQPDTLACCQACDKSGCSRVWCTNGSIGGWHY